MLAVAVTVAVAAAAGEVYCMYQFQVARSGALASLSVYPFEHDACKEGEEGEGEGMRKGNALARLNEELRDFFLETMKGEASLGARRKPPTVSLRCSHNRL